MHMLQIICVLLNLSIVLLNTKEKALVWPVTLVSTVLGFSAYYQKGLYAKCVLYGIYWIVDGYGWYQWLHGSKGKTPLRVSTTSLRTMRVLSLAGVVCTLCLWRIFAKCTHAHLVFIDSVHTALGLIAQWMTARKKLESWIVWAIADIMYVFVCYQRQLYWFSGIHVVYLVLAVRGYRTWRQSYWRQKTMVSVNSEDDIPG